MKVAEGNTTPEEIVKRINNSLTTNVTTQETVARCVNDYVIDNDIATAVDETLTVSGEAADAKIVGDEIERLDGEINSVQEIANTATNIAKGRNRAHVFATTEAMRVFISDETNKGVYNVGDNLYIVDIGVPDWWISEVLESADAETGYYYKIAQLETQKVDLTEILEDIEKNATDISTLNGELNNYSPLIGGIPIPANADLNDYHTIGKYACAKSADAQTLKNNPCQIAFTMEVDMGTGGGYERQTIRSYDLGFVYTRTYIAITSSWSKWESNARSSDLENKSSINSPYVDQDIINYVESRENGSFSFTYVGWSSDGTILNGAPSNSHGTIYANKLSNTHITMLAVTYSGEIYVKSKNNKVWDTEWIKHAKSSALGKMSYYHNGLSPITIDGVEYTGAEIVGIKIEHSPTRYTIVATACGGSDANVWGKYINAKTIIYRKVTEEYDSGWYSDLTSSALTNFIVKRSNTQTFTIPSHDGKTLGMPMTPGGYTLLNTEVILDNVDVTHMRHSNGNLELLNNTDSEQYVVATVDAYYIKNECIGFW